MAGLVSSLGKYPSRTSPFLIHNGKVEFVPGDCIPIFHY